MQAQVRPRQDQERLWVDIGTHVFFLAILVLAIVSCRERLFADSGYYLFHTLNTGHFWIEHGRFVLALSQVAPLIGASLGLNLDQVLVLYSAGHVLFCYLVYLLARFRYRATYAGPYLVLIQTLGIASGWFAPMFELYYGAALLILIDILLRRQIHHWPDWALLITVTSLTLSSHPMAFVLVGMVLLFHWLDVRQINKKNVSIAVLMLIIAAIKALFASGYEQARMEQVWKVIDENPLGPAYWLDVAGLLLQWYVPVLLMIVAVLVRLIRQGKSMHWMLVLISTFGLIFLAVLQNYGTEHTRYQEQAYFPLSVMATYVCVRYLFLHLSMTGRRMAWLGLALLVMWKIWIIEREWGAFRLRTDTIERLVAVAQERPGTKFVIDEYNVSLPTGPGPNWSYGIESLLLSAADGHQKTVTVCLDSDMAARNNADRITPDEFLLRKWDILPIDDLNARWFQLDRSTYAHLNAQRVVIDTIDHLLGNAELRIDGPKACLPRDRICYLPVTVRNHSTETLYASQANQLLLSYHWMHGDTIVTWDGLRTPLESDVIDIYAQTMAIRTPARAGRYTLVLDLVAEHRGWLGADCRMDVNIQ
ncbi:MAG: hypothetical protein R3301_06060 [Saprospiraceae bacterium]|nr:hypothetical protein [Saprospiraceae bacterium]